MSPGKESGHVSWSEILTTEYAPPLALVSLGVWLHAADSLIVATMMPAIVGELGGDALVAWTIALYEVGSIVAGATSGFVASRLGIRAPMSSAAAFFAFGCIVSALAPSMPVLLAGRLLQGLGGGALVSLAFVAVSLLFPRRVIARVLAVVSVLWGASAFLGPLVGGLFVEFASWRWGFAFFSLQAAALALWIAMASRLGRLAEAGARGNRVPLARLAALAVGIVSIAYAGIEIGFVSTTLLVGAGAVCLSIFLVLDARAGDDRLLPRDPFSLATGHGGALLMVLCFSAGTIALAAYGPLLMTVLHGTPVLVAGYVIALESVGWTIAAVLVSGADERHDPRLIGSGSLLIAGCVAGLVYAVPSGPVWLIAAFSLGEGAGFGMAWTFILRRATSLAPVDETERISAALPTVQRLGYALGAAYVGIVANAAGFDSATGAAETFRPALWIFASALPPAAIGLVAMRRFVVLPTRRARAT